MVDLIAYQEISFLLVLKAKTKKVSLLINYSIRGYTNECVDSTHDELLLYLPIAVIVCSTIGYEPYNGKDRINTMLEYFLLLVNN